MSKTERKCVFFFGWERQARISFLPRKPNGPTGGVSNATTPPPRASPKARPKARPRTPTAERRRRCCAAPKRRRRRRPRRARRRTSTSSKWKRARAATWRRCSTDPAAATSRRPTSSSSSRRRVPAASATTSVGRCRRCRRCRRRRRRPRNPSTATASAVLCTRTGTSARPSSSSIRWRGRCAPASAGRRRSTPASRTRRTRRGATAPTAARCASTRPTATASTATAGRAFKQRRRPSPVRWRAFGTVSEAFADTNTIHDWLPIDCRPIRRRILHINATSLCIGRRLANINLGTTTARRNMEDPQSHPDFLCAASRLLIECKLAARKLRLLAWP